MTSVTNQRQPSVSSVVSVVDKIILQRKVAGIWHHSHHQVKLWKVIVITFWSTAMGVATLVLTPVARKVMITTWTIKLVWAQELHPRDRWHCKRIA
eukprot:GSChrysophyteH1.ASY1.ANO1.2725.1 assembled CDS